MHYITEQHINRLKGVVRLGKDRIGRKGTENGTGKRAAPDAAALPQKGILHGLSLENSFGLRTGRWLHQAQKSIGGCLFAPSRKSLPP